MSNGNFVFKLANQRENGIQTMKNRVTTAEKNALLGARPERLRLEGMFEIVHAVQKVTGDCCYDPKLQG
jgi:hypothetical protein